MSDTPLEASAPYVVPPTGDAARASGAALGAALGPFSEIKQPVRLRLLWAAAAVLLLLCVISLALAWRVQQRVKGLEQELVRRQQDSQGLSSEAKMLAKQAQEAVLESGAKMALLEARVAEVAVQRGQLEELMQSLSRSRDENLLVDVDAGIRVAIQQSAITGTAEPLVAVLKQADERLQRYNQPRLEGVRRAIARDLDRVRTVSVADLPSLSIKLDEAVRLIDELPLIANAEQRRDLPRGVTSEATGGASAGASAASAPRAASVPQTAASGWFGTWGEGWGVATSRFWQDLWQDVKALLRVTRIEHPEAMLLAPENAFFLRENLKLRLLNARLALMSRQFDTAQADLQQAQAALERYFDRGSRRSVLAAELVRQVAVQARQVTVPRPDDTLSALAAASAGR